MFNAQGLVVPRLKQFIQIAEPVDSPVPGQAVSPPLGLGCAAQLLSIDSVGILAGRQHFGVLGMGVIDAIPEVPNRLNVVNSLPIEVRRVIAESQRWRWHRFKHGIPHFRSSGQHSAVAGPVFEGKLHILGLGLGSDRGVQLLENRDIFVST